MEPNQTVLGIDSRWIVYSYQSGAEADKLSFNVLMRKRITLTGTVLRARSIEYKNDLVKRFETEALQGFVNGQLKAVTDKIWPIGEISAAHEYMENNLTMGKIVMTLQ